MLFDLKNQKHDGRTYTKTSDDISTNRRNESLTSIVHAPLRSGIHTMMGGLISFVMILVYIFYIHNVVGGGVNFTGLIYGGGIHRTRRYRCVHMHIQLKSIYII